ncbi:MAG: ATP-grasp domain-containing protein [Gammaproteobacteria bacterium]
MKILLYEFITGGGLNGRNLPFTLAQEGDLMVQALVQDLAQLPAIEVWVCRDARLPLLTSGDNLRVLPVPEGSDIDSFLDEWIQYCDAVWPIAPETGGVLEGLCHRVHAAGKRLPTSPAEAVRLCGDKLRTVERLQQYGIPTVTTYCLSDTLPASNEGWVVKARDGAGCSDSYIVETAHDYQSVKSALKPAANFILQPFIAAKPVSLSCLFKHGRAALLSYNEQQIAIYGRHFELQGCIVNAPCPDWQYYRQFAERVAHTFPALWGYAGLDLLETPDGPLLLEINPRLTTSYAGLSRALQKNIAQYVLNLFHADLPQCIPQGQAVAVTVPPGEGYGA